MIDENFLIKEVHTPQELLDVQHLHKEIWGLVDLEVTPGHIYIAVQKAKGLVLCAYHEGKPIGFSFGFCGLNDTDELYLHSHNIGVLDEFRNSGVGYQIKCKQRECALERGIDLISWTFDPLESRNANFNFGKLGCISRKYVRNYYGSMPDQLNENLDSDRLIVEWQLNSEKVINCLGRGNDKHEQFSDKFLFNKTTTEDSDFLKPLEVNETVEKLLNDEISMLFVEIPSNYQIMRQENFNLVVEWRFAVRKFLEACFLKKLYITSFLYSQGRSFYKLEKMS